MKFTGLKEVLKTFDEHGWKGSFTRGLWEIGNGGYDCWFELYYKCLPVARCIAGELESNVPWVDDVEKEKMFNKILEVYDHLKVCDKVPLNNDVVADENNILSPIEQRYVYENGVKRKVENSLICALVEDELYEYSQADRGVIADCVSYLMSDIRAEHDSEDVSLERKVFDAVKTYLGEGHSVYELDHLEDRFEVLENVQYVCISKKPLNEVIKSCSQKVRNSSQHEPKRQDLEI